MPDVRATASLTAWVASGLNPSTRTIRPQLIQKVRPIQRIPLLGDEAGIADHAPQFFLARTMMRARGGHHVLLDHDAADVIAAEAQPYLASLQSLSDPGTLHVLEVFEVNARDREHLQVLDRGCFLFDEPPERSVLALERPRDERGESAGLRLQVADQVEMIHPLLDGFTAAEHHRGSGSHAELV